MEELEVKEHEFHNLHALLNAGETVGDLVSAIEAIGIYSRDKPRDEYGRAITNNCSVNEMKCADIKKKLAYYHHTVNLMKNERLEEFGDWDDVEFLSGWETPNKRPFYQPNIYLIYLNNGWYGNKYFDFKKGLKGKGHEAQGGAGGKVVSTTESKELGKGKRQRYREDVLISWLESKGYNTSVKKVGVVQSRKKVWEELQKIDSNLFRAGKEDFFKGQELCSFQPGRRKEKE
jgi:hypothetical protein